MNLLLDTHIALWWLADDASLSEPVRDHISNTRNLVFVSAATVWEVSINASIGKLVVDDSWLDALLADGIQQLPIRWSHAEHVRQLPMIHRDPFDRLLIAQATDERLILVTADETIPTYPVQCLVN
ncbi:MAG: type II toxin-antitoxin system VapC family toxin [Spirochaetota bacterium]